MSVPFPPQTTSSGSVPDPSPISLVTWNPKLQHDLYFLKKPQPVAFIAAHSTYLEYSFTNTLFNSGDSLKATSSARFEPFSLPQHKAQQLIMKAISPLSGDHATFLDDSKLWNFVRT